MKNAVVSKGLLTFTTISVFTIGTANAQIFLTYDAADSIPDDGNSFSVAGTPGYGNQIVREGLYAFELTGIDSIPDVGFANMGGTRLELFNFPGEQLPDGDYIANPFHYTSTPSGWGIADQYSSGLSFGFYHPSGSVDGVFTVAATADLSGTVNWAYHDDLNQVYASGTVTLPVPVPVQFVPEPSQFVLVCAAAALFVTTRLYSAGRARAAVRIRK